MPTNVVKVEIRTSEDDQFYFVGMAGNSEVVVTSELYTRRDDAARGATSVFPGVPQWNAPEIELPQEPDAANGGWPEGDPGDENGA